MQLQANAKLVRLKACINQFSTVYLTDQLVDQSPQLPRPLRDARPHPRPQVGPHGAGWTFQLLAEP